MLKSKFGVKEVPNLVFLALILVVMVGLPFVYFIDESPGPPVGSPLHSVVEESTNVVVEGGFDSEEESGGLEDTSKLDEIRDEFKHAWKAYKDYAWGMDDVHPIARKGSNGYFMGLTLVDSIDTIILMGLEDEYLECRNWVDEKFMKIQLPTDVSVFETTIRVIGGLLSAFHLKSDTMFLKKATALADRLIIAFDTPSALPLASVNLQANIAFGPKWNGGSSSVSEVASIQIEWQDLSRLSGDPKYAEKVNAAADRVSTMSRKDGLFTKFISPQSGKMTDTVVTLGARVDSIYEYFLKQYLLDSQNVQALKMYEETMERILNQLMRKSSPSGLVYFQELVSGKANGKMDHLVCFMPGMMALGAHYIPDQFESHLEHAKGAMRTCYEFYARQSTGLAPEIVQFKEGIDFVVDNGAKHNLLRPETVESLFYLWRTTHDPIYREWGWNIFQSFKKYCKLPEAGYSALNDVLDASSANGNMNSTNRRDHMESFFLGETMKYLFLLFSDDSVLSLDEFVFNTEAHPLKRWTAEPL